MKKVFAVLLAAAMAVSMTACSKQGGDKSQGGADVADSLTLLNTVWSAYNEDEKFPASGGDYENSVSDAPGAFDISNAENLEFMLALPQDCVGMIDDAASLMHMMNANTFTCGAFRVVDAENLSKVADGLHDSIQGKQWMCGFPDKLVILTLDNYVVSMYGGQEQVDTFLSKLQGAYSTAAVAYDEPIA